MRAIGEMTSRRWDRSKVAFAGVLAVLLAASAAAVLLLDNLYLKPYSRQADLASLRELGLRAERASRKHARRQQAELGDLCSWWLEAPNWGHVIRRCAAMDGPAPLAPGARVAKEADAACLTDASGKVLAVWTAPLTGTGAWVLAAKDWAGLAQIVRGPESPAAEGLCRLGGKLAFFARRGVKDGDGAAGPAGYMWLARVVDSKRLAEWGSAVGGKVELADLGKGPGGVLFDEGGRPMLQFVSGHGLMIRWPLQGPAGEALGAIECSLIAPRSQAAGTFRGTLLAVVSGCLALALLALVQSYALVRRPLKRFLVRLHRLRTGEATIDQVSEGLRGPALALAEELGRSITSLAQDCRADPMTGLANRRHFRQTLEAFYSQAVRHGRPLSVLVMDVDHFKRVNDTLGHLQGDEVIRRAARTIGSSLRGADLAARFGGDEFAVLMPDTTAEQAAEVAERIRQRMMAVKAPASLAGGISVSIGVADLESGPVTCSEDLIDLADKSLYAVKARGRNKVLLAHTLGGDLQFSEIGA